MQMRMVPVAPLFQRFHRVVRDLCRELGKQAHLEMHGEATELDKKLIDELVDPLTHLIRNALDHGLEPAVSRIAAGKPETGTVILEAFQEGGQICIRITDDGRGINPVSIKAKAVEKGIITQIQADEMDNANARALVFLPGFSTAVNVSNVSGRGVGMDIVRSKISELKGTVDIDSTIGKGTSFTIRLPLTLAMIQALLVEIGGERFALPLDAVREIVEIDAARIHQVDGGCQFIPLRDGIVAVADLPRVLGLKPHHHDQGTIRAVITKSGREPLAIPVDRVLREEEIVIKALPEEFSRVRGLAGASILGDGGIALILDIPIIIERSCAIIEPSHA
jgi:two-component system chemotaxis sensor kinase CheA